MQLKLLPPATSGPTPAQYASDLLLSSTRKPPYLINVIVIDENVVQLILRTASFKQVQPLVCVSRTKKSYRKFRSRNSLNRETILAHRSQRPAHTIDSLLRICNRFHHQERIKGKKPHAKDEVRQNQTRHFLAEFHQDQLLESHA